MSSISQAFETSKTRSVRIYRWVIVWLCLSAVIALLLLANSIRDYRFVARLIATQQVRHQMSQQAAALERQLRQDPLTRGSAVNSLMDAAGRPVWIQLRGPDGKVLEHVGATAQQLFSDDEERTHARNHDPLFTVVPSSVGDVVVEVFAIHAPAAPMPANPPAQSGPPTPLMLEMAMYLSAVDPSIFWPIRRNLFINCSGAIALLITVVVAGLGFRSYVRGQFLEQQLEIARQVQAELLPSQPGALGNVSLATEYRPAEQVGGDFYDVFGIRDGGVALVIGDVSGKGVPAALLMGVIHGAVRSSSWTESASHHEGESERLNRLLCEHASGDRFASMFWCYYDSRAGMLRYVNAGHCPSLLAAKRNGQLEMVRLEAGGPVLGVLPEARYEQASLELRAGDVLILYTDGLIEATNSVGEEYGEVRLRDLLASLPNSRPEEIRRAIVESVGKFLGATSPQDDLTFVIAQWT
jgi:Stage II sporulation protein E (SpoIIE)